MTACLADAGRRARGGRGGLDTSTHPSFWTRRVQFVSESAPVNGVWLLVRTVARVTVRWFGEYVGRSECGPHEMVLMPATTSDR